MIRVCLVDDHELVRSGIAGLLALVDDIEVVAEAGDGVEALEVIGRTRPDVVLLDVRLPRIDGLGVLRALQRKENAPAVVILTTFDDDRVMRDALAEGARGFLLKDASLEQLAEAIRKARAGQTYVQPASRGRLADVLARKGELDYETRPANDLTDREIEVLRLVARGFSNGEIAGVLGIAEGTVKNHVSSLLSKLGVRDRTRATLAAIERDLI
ncbi:MAG: response regulator [Planctomycetota bacterium]